jgi:hypothetical protein
VEFVGEKQRAAYADGQLQEFSEQCRSKGLAITPQRLAVVDPVSTARPTYSDRVRLSSTASPALMIVRATPATIVAIKFKRGGSSGQGKNPEDDQSQTTDCFVDSNSHPLGYTREKFPSAASVTVICVPSVK